MITQHGRTGRIASRFGSDLAPVRPNAVLTPSVRTSHADGAPRALGPVRGPERHASTARPHTHDGFLAAGSAARDRALLWMRHTLRHTQRQLARHSHSWVPRTRPHRTAQHVMSGPAAPPAHPPSALASGAPPIANSSSMDSCATLADTTPLLLQVLYSNGDDRAPGDHVPR